VIYKTTNPISLLSRPTTSVAVPIVLDGVGMQDRRSVSELEAILPVNRLFPPILHQRLVGPFTEI
jgi:hypothetical protein